MDLVRGLLRIFALKSHGERMQLRRHQPRDDSRIAFHECSRRRFILRFKDRDAKRLVAWFLCAASQNQFAGLDGMLESSEVRSSAILSSFVQAASEYSRGTSRNT